MHNKLFESVLLIDDDKIENRINQIIIQSCDFARFIHITNSAKSGIRFLESTVGTTGKIPDFVFLDIKMPDMDGFSFLDQFAHLSEPIKNRCQIIMLTSSVDVIDYNRAINNQYVRNYLKKPLNTLELLSLVS